MESQVYEEGICFLFKLHRFTPFGDGMVTVLVPHFGAHEHSLFLWNTKNLNTPVHTFVGHRYACMMYIHFYWVSTAFSFANPLPLPPFTPTPLHPLARTLLLVVV